MRYFSSAEYLDHSGMGLFTTAVLNSAIIGTLLLTDIFGDIFEYGVLGGVMLVYEERFAEKLLGIASSKHEIVMPQTKVERTPKSSQRLCGNQRLTALS